jgi:hypothetical protein
VSLRLLVRATLTRPSAQAADSRLSSLADTAPPVSVVLEARLLPQRPVHPCHDCQDALAQLWWDIARDETRRDRDRLEASRLLADRGWGKAPTHAAIEEADPLDLANLEQAAEDFRQRILRLAPSEPDSQ